MATKRVTTKDVLESVKALIEHVEKTAPNGELKEMRDTMKSLFDRQESHRIEMNEAVGAVHECVRKIEKRLYNPDDGVIVQMKDNSRVVNDLKQQNKEYQKDVADIHNTISVLADWKGSLSKGFWVLLPLVLSGIVALIWMIAK